MAKYTLDYRVPNGYNAIGNSIRGEIWGLILGLTGLPSGRLLWEALSSVSQISQLEHSQIYLNVTLAKGCFAL